MKDNISDMITRIRNGQKSKLYEIDLYYPTPLICLNILNVLYKEGYIRGLKKTYKNNNLHLKVLLKYDIQGSPVIKNIERISKPSRKVYTSIKSLWKINSGAGIFLLSTPKGVLTDFEARKFNVGGEILFYIA